MMDKTAHKRLFTFIVLALAFAACAIGASAYSGFPTPNYPMNMYGMESSYRSGPWGQVMVHGAYSYFPNYNGNYPYGYRTYGYFYTPWDLRYGNTMGYGSSYGGYGSYGYGNGFVTGGGRPY